MARGHGKGSEFERTICKRLSLWWTQDERDDVFWRSSTSGARAKTRAKTGQGTFGQYGDIQATDPVGQPLIDMFTFELKIGYGKASVADVLDKGLKSAQQLWEGWVNQVKEDHKNAGSLFWALITKRDRREPVMFIPTRAYHTLIKAGVELKMARPWTLIILPNGERIISLLFTQFLLFTSPSTIIKVINTLKD